VTARTSLCSVLRQGPPPTATAVSLQGGLGAHMEETVRRVTSRGNVSSPRDYTKAELVIFSSPRVYKDRFENFSNSKRLHDYLHIFHIFLLVSLIFLHVFHIFLHISHIFFHLSHIFPSYFPHISSYFSHIPKSLKSRGGQKF